MITFAPITPYRGQFYTPPHTIDTTTTTNTYAVSFNTTITPRVLTTYDMGVDHFLNQTAPPSAVAPLFDVAYIFLSYQLPTGISAVPCIGMIGTQPQAIFVLAPLGHGW